MKILLLLLAVSASSVCAKEVNLIIFGPLTQMDEDPTTLEEVRIPYTLGRYLPNFASAVRAIDDVNNRDNRILPENSVRGDACNITYNYHMMDSVISFSTAIKQYFALKEALAQRGEIIGGIIGPGRSSVAVGLSTIATVDNVPMISYSATSPSLDNRAQHRTFMRTITSDDSVAFPMCGFLNYFSYPQANVIYVEDDYGKAFKDALVANCYEMGIVLNVFPFKNKDDDSITASLQKLKETDVNINIGILFLEDLSTLMQEATRLDMTGEGHNWIFSDGVSGSSSDIEDVIASCANPEAMAAALNGTTQISVTGNLDTIDGFKRFKEEYHNLTDTEKLMQYVPGGSRNVDIDSDFVYPLTLERDFFADREPGLFEGFAYDAAIAMIIGISEQCIDGEMTGPVDGEAMLSSNIQFAGVSGSTVQFSLETGSRLPNTTHFKASNIIVSADGAHVTFDSRNALWIAEENEWYISTEYVFPGGTNEAPPFTDPVENVNHNLVETGARSVVFTIAAVLIVLYLVTLGWVIYARRIPVLSASQPMFLIAALIGIIIGCLATFTIGWDESHFDIDTLTMLCNLQWWLISFGLTLCVSALLVKLYRIQRLFASTAKLRKITITWKLLTVMMCSALAVDVLLLSLWTAFDPFVYDRINVRTDGFDQVEESFGACRGGDGMLFVPVVIFHLLQYTVGGVLAYKTRNISTDFQEAKWITLAVFSQFQLCLIAVPIILSLEERSRNVYFIVMGMSICITTLTLATLLFIPKVLRVYYGEDEVKTYSSKDEYNAGRQSSRSPTGYMPSYRSESEHFGASRRGDFSFSRGNSSPAVTSDKKRRSLWTSIRGLSFRRSSVKYVSASTQTEMYPEAAWNIGRIEEEISSEHKLSSATSTSERSGTGSTLSYGNYDKTTDQMVQT